MARVKLMAAMVIYLCATASADLEAADAEAAAVSIFISASDNADMFVDTRAPHSHRYASQRNQTGQQIDSRVLLLSMSSLRSPAALDLGSSRLLSSLIRLILL